MRDNDTLRDLCIQKGYVPPNCKLAGMIIMGLINKGENPCDGCNHDRNDCGGCPRKLLEYDELSDYDKEKYNRYIKEQNLRIEKEKRGLKRLNNKSNELIMDVSIERNCREEYVYINIKDKIKEDCYTMKLNESINKCCEIAVMFIEKFKIKEVHIDTINIGISVHDCLIHNLKIHNIDWCDVIGFKYKRLDFDTKINDYDNKNKIPENLEIYKNYTNK